MQILTHWHLALKMKLHVPVEPAVLRVLDMAESPIQAWIADLVIWLLRDWRLNGLDTVRAPKGCLLVQTT